MSRGGHERPPEGTSHHAPVKSRGGVHARTLHGLGALTRPVRGTSSCQARALEEHVRSPHGRRGAHVCAQGGAHTLAPLSLPALFFHSPSKVIVTSRIPFRKKK
jgi:hypothetical protein